MRWPSFLRWAVLSSLVAIAWLGGAVAAAAAPATPRARTLWDLPRALRHAHYRLIPLPVVAIDPAEGQTYGAMPVVVALDEREEIVGILATALTYNSVMKVGGFGTVILAPSPKEELRLFGGAAYRFYREASVDYANARWLAGRLQSQAHFLYLSDPFERFFGFGPDTPEAAESNFTSEWFRGWGEVSYTMLPRLSVVAQAEWARLQINPRAVQQLLDTSTTYGHLPEVTGANYVTYRAGARWESRDDLFFPTRGLHAQLLGIVAHAVTGPPAPFGGYEARLKFAWQPHRRCTTVGSWRLQQLFGRQIPFAWQSSLGGEKELRGFVARRFTDRHGVVLDLEERILVKEWAMLGTKVAFSVDPFFSVGQVFRRADDLRFRHLEPTGGIGFRMRAAPAVLGRVDVGYGRDGLAVYTTLDYPF